MKVYQTLTIPFRADAPNQLWLTDITEHPTLEGKLYACVVRDMFAGRIVGVATSDRMTAQLAIDALELAIARRDPPAGCVVHSDRGAQFQSKKYLNILSDNGLRGSMGAVGTSADNAAMESWFALLQKNVLNTRVWDTRSELAQAIWAWTHVTYDTRRRQRVLGRMTPQECELVYSETTVSLAAS